MAHLLAGQRRGPGRVCLQERLSAEGNPLPRQFPPLPRRAAAAAGPAVTAGRRAPGCAGSLPPGRQAGSGRALLSVGFPEGNPLPGLPLRAQLFLPRLWAGRAAQPEPSAPAEPARAGSLSGSPSSPHLLPSSVLCCYRRRLKALDLGAAMNRCGRRQHVPVCTGTRASAPKQSKRRSSHVSCPVTQRAL